MIPGVFVRRTKRRVTVAVRKAGGEIVMRSVWPASVRLASGRMSLAMARDIAAAVGIEVREPEHVSRAG